MPVKSEPVPVASEEPQDKEDECGLCEPDDVDVYSDEESDEEEDEPKPDEAAEEEPEKAADASLDDPT